MLPFPPHDRLENGRSRAVQVARGRSS
jgi:hypothetical protein